MKTDNKQLTDTSKAISEIREYSNMEIIWMDSPFPDNHLFCKRGRYCEFTETSKYVQAYLYPQSKEQSKEETVKGKGGLDRGVYNACILALEFGYKQCEKGNNLEMAILNYNKIVNS